MTLPLAPYPGRIALIGCGKAKQSQAAPAAELYTSSLFRLSVKYARQYCRDFFILSAKHGLLAPWEKVEPYDLAITDLNEDEFRAWHARVVEQIKTRCSSDDTFVLLAGQDYADLASCIPNFVEQPLYLRPLFSRLRWLGEVTRNEVPKQPIDAGWWCQDCDEEESWEEPTAMYACAAEHVRQTGHYVQVHIKHQATEPR